MAKRRKKEKKVILEEEKGAKNKLREGDLVLYSSNTHIEKTQVKSIEKRVAILNNGIRVFKRYNEAIIREDGKSGYVILPWTEEAQEKWETYTLSFELIQMLNTTLGDLKEKKMPLDNIKKYHSKLSKLMNR